MLKELFILGVLFVFGTQEEFLKNPGNVPIFPQEIAYFDNAKSCDSARILLENHMRESLRNGTMPVPLHEGQPPNLIIVDCFKIN